MAEVKRIHESRWILKRKIRDWCKAKITRAAKNRRKAKGSSKDKLKRSWKIEVIIGIGEKSMEIKSRWGSQKIKGAGINVYFWTQ